MTHTKKNTVAQTLQDNIQDIIDYRKQGIKNKELAIMYHTSESSLTRTLENNGYYTRNLLPKTPENKQILINEYLGGKTMGVIAKEYGVSRSTISNILTENHIPIRNAYKITYALNQHYFDNVDTPEKAYIFGFLAADGCVSGNIISVGVQEDDKQILDDINMCLGSNRPLYYIKTDVGKNQWRLQITNKYLAEQLKLHGLIERKSLKLEFPECISDDLLPHFLRGLLDGDGSIGSTRYCVSYTGTKMLLSVIAEKIERILHITFHYRKEHCYNNITCGIGLYKQEHCRLFLNYIYQNATIYLERKYKLYQKYINKSLLLKAS